jgi:hypothetical protein
MQSLRSIFSGHIAPTRKSKGRGIHLVPLLLFLFVNSVLSRDRVEFLEFELISVLFLVLTGVVDMALSDPL